MGETLRARRARGESWDPRFFERDERFWPIAQAARAFACHTDWPAPEELRAPGVRFVTQEKKPRRASALDREQMYDACIARGEVPTRARSWHDFLNALVWASFPRAKRALHARQHAIIRAWIPEGALRLPNARTREHDALALVDEGGVLLAGARAIPFGHALFEGLVMGTPAMIARAVPLDCDMDDVDEALAARLARPLLPEDLPRFTFR